MSLYFYCYAESHYAENHYAECRYAECPYAELSWTLNFIWHHKINFVDVMKHHIKKSLKR